MSHIDLIANITTATPAEIDTELARIYVERKRTEARIAEATIATHHVAGDQGRPTRTGRRYNLTDAQALTAVENLAKGDDWRADEAETLLARLGALTVAYQHCFDLARPLEAEFERRGGWARFFLVISSNGHIHSSMSCSTCTPRTSYSWLPDASGQTMAEAIAERDKLDSAALLCTVCFPDAPVEWTEKPVDSKVCPGSGTTDYDRETARRGYVSGNYGICNHCHQPATIVGAHGVKMRKHNKA